MTARQAALAVEDPINAARPCFDKLPYRMMVFARLSPHQVPLYLVAGSPMAASGARKALKEAHRLHGGDCFFCRESVSEGDLAIDHAEPRARGGKDDIQNLLIACTRCNRAKGSKAIELFEPEAGREWLSAILMHVRVRLNRL